MWGHSSEKATVSYPEGSLQNPAVWSTLTACFQPSELQEVNSFCYKPHSLQYCQLQVGTCRGHLPSTSTRIKSCAAAAADLQHPLKGVQGGVQKWGSLCSRKTGRTGLPTVRHYQEVILRYYQEVILWTHFYYLFKSRTALKSFTVMTALHD